jgi:hypothetical protein
VVRLQRLVLRQSRMFSTNDGTLSTLAAATVGHELLGAVVQILDFEERAVSAGLGSEPKREFCPLHTATRRKTCTEKSTRTEQCQ